MSIRKATVILLVGIQCCRGADNSTRKQQEENHEGILGALGTFVSSALGGGGSLVYEESSIKRKIDRKSEPDTILKTETLKISIAPPKQHSSSGRVFQDDIVELEVECNDAFDPTDPTRYHHEVESGLGRKIIGNIQGVHSLKNNTISKSTLPRMLIYHAGGMALGNAMIG